MRTVDARGLGIRALRLFPLHRDLHPDQIHQDRSAAGCELSPHVAPAQHLNDGIGIPSGSRETEATLVERSRELGDGSRDVGGGIGRRTSDEERDARIAFGLCCLKNARGAALDNISAKMTSSRRMAEV